MSDPGRISYQSTNLTFLLQRALDIKSYQIDGIDIMQMPLYDFEAKLPQGATQDQVPGDACKPLLADSSPV